MGYQQHYSTKVLESQCYLGNKKPCIATEACKSSAVCPDLPLFFAKTPFGLTLFKTQKIVLSGVFSLVVEEI